MDSVPMSCTCDRLLNIENKCVRCGVKALAALEPHQALESVGLPSLKILVLSLCLPFQSIIKRAVGIEVSSFPWEEYL